MNGFTTRPGTVRGGPAGRPGIVALRGIPYAAPPFGAARFRAPRPAAPWAGVRDCTRFGPVAPQSARLPGAPGWTAGDEDVLTLNIWTPGTEGDTLPVLVWIHGGAFAYGSSAQPDFDGTTLAALGLVVVTLNYRLGFEGFGHVPPPAGGGEPCPDNRGLLDQIAALTWVRDNIAAFGGSARDVTVAGQSAGATSVACLTVMERARGLFRRAVLHSAVNACATVRSAAATTAEVAAAAGTPATHEALLQVPPAVLVAASDTVAARYRDDPGSGPRHYDPAVHGPVAGGDTLPLDPLTAYEAGAGAGVDLLVCHTTEEYWLLDAVGDSAEITTDSGLDAFAADFGLPKTLLDDYRALLPGAPAGEVHLAVHGDLLFAEYSSRLADAHARAGGRTHLARFARRRGGRGQPVRAWHCADVPFAFGTLDRADVHFLIGGEPGAADHALAERMTRAWAGFAATGDPGWPRLRADGEGEVRIWDTDGEGEVRNRDTDGNGEVRNRDTGGGGVPGRRDAFRAPWRKAGLPLMEP
ncbi:carboxylesterase/lipase family protein [Streptomyces nitrosporeus]|uniref:carboxylesterase/lipase family protein n=1 Tax=Streptomyces nitrosporeus TaxID=28894 RepID=UPI00332E6D08